MIFKDRYYAGSKLAEKLSKYRNTKSVVLAIPRGGLEVGFVISKKLGLPLDIILTKKIGHPFNKEYAIGAVSIHGKIITDNSVPEEYIKKETKRLRDLLKKMYKTYIGKSQPLDLKDKNVIITDDGIATGSTILAAINIVKKNKPKKVIIAIPVSHTDAIEKIKDESDDIVCLKVDSSLAAIGQYYENFEQVSDEESIRLLWEANKNLNKDS